MKNQLYLYLITWNSARIPGPTPSFGEHILEGIPAGSDAPDLLVLTLQEAAPLASAFLGGKFLEPYVRAYVAAIQNATQIVLGEEYRVAAVNNVGMTVVMVFARSGDEGRVKFVEYGGVGCGVWGIGNKAGVGVRIGYEVEVSSGGRDTVELHFVGAHLAPHEWLVENRNRDWETIVRGLVFERAEEYGRIPVRADLDDESAEAPLIAAAGPGGGVDETELEESGLTIATTATADSRLMGIYEPRAHAFVMGDLNYRTARSRPRDADHLLFPQPSNRDQDASHLLERDQCRQERLSSRTLQGFDEGRISFPPTYKFKLRGPESLRYHAGHWDWSLKRWPSWTDRILYLPFKLPPRPQPEAGGGDDAVVVHKYASIPQVMGSDHKPVVCYFAVPTTPLHQLGASEGWKDVRRNPPFPLDGDWKEKRVRVRVLEIAIGVAAYLTTTRAGLGILVGGIIGVTTVWWVLVGSW